MTYRVEIRKGWSYVVGSPSDLSPRDPGPWRYQWEAQKYAEELNQRNAKAGGETTITVPRRVP